MIVRHLPFLWKWSLQVIGALSLLLVGCSPSSQLVDFEEKKKEERESARKAQKETKVAEKGKIVKEESTSNAPTSAAEDLGSAADKLP